MARWLVQLSGERIDLEEFTGAFPDGDIFALEEKRIFYLSGHGFEALPNNETVRREAIRVLDQFSGVISLLLPNFRKPIIGGVVREDDDGRRHVYVSVSNGVSLRATAGAVVAGSPPQPPRITRAQELTGPSDGQATP